MSFVSYPHLILLISGQTVEATVAHKFFWELKEPACRVPSRLSQPRREHCRRTALEVNCPFDARAVEQAITVNTTRAISGYMERQAGWAHFQPPPTSLPAAPHRGTACVHLPFPTAARPASIFLFLKGPAGRSAWTWKKNLVRCGKGTPTDGHVRVPARSSSSLVTPSRPRRATGKDCGR